MYLSYSFVNTKMMDSLGIQNTTKYVNKLAIVLFRAVFDLCLFLEGFISIGLSLPSNMRDYRFYFLLLERLQALVLIRGVSVHIMSSFYIFLDRILPCIFSAAFLWDCWLAF